MALPRGVVQRRVSQRVAHMHERPSLEQRLRRALCPVQRGSVQRRAPGRGVRAIREPATHRERPAPTPTPTPTPIGRVGGEREGEARGVIARGGEVHEEREERALGRRGLRGRPAPRRGRLVCLRVGRAHRDAVHEDARGAARRGGRYGEADDLGEEALEVVEARAG